MNRKNEELSGGKRQTMENGKCAAESVKRWKTENVQRKASNDGKRRIEQRKASNDGKRKMSNGKEAAPHPRLSDFLLSPPAQSLTDDEPGR